ncbi:lamin tail domain-containing protein [Dokdonella sp.]|uniref:lamin tail domain-containing protein n=1 Tax=Dokdonella sp. TaxID=2291710 RepID=UPI0025B96688|nr:lamin tail domain-containing protein [Dokdonella sp.]MBX3692895.1 lamin tail domain-containing protein [Dokdonella sp.]
MLRSIKLFGAALVLAGASAGASAQVVISQVYGGGGNSGAPYTHDFVELFNRGATAQSLAGWSVQYTSATGNGNFAIGATLTGSIPPGGYYLVQMSGGTNGAPLPTPDATGTSAMNSTNGKVILANVDSNIACNGGSTACNPTQLGQIVDLVGFGTANFHEGAAPAPAPGNTTSISRLDGGCTDSDDNGADFTTGPVNPRNSQSPTNLCGGPALPTASMANVSLPEGDTGTTPFVFTVSLSTTPASDVTFAYATANGTAIAGTDYVASSGNGTISAGNASTTITIDVIANTTPQPNRTFSLSLTGISGAVPATLSATGTIQDDDIATYAIHQIQGSGLASPIVGQRARTEGNIVTAIGPQGFWMQTPDDATDNDPLTSEGIYAFTGSAPTVAVGDAVTLFGTVTEYFDLTELTSVSGLVVTSSGNTLPAAIEFDAATPSPDPDNLSCGTLSNLECFEGMRINIAEGIVARGNQYFSTDNYGQVFVSAGPERSLRGPGTLYPLVPGVGNPAAGRFSGNPHIFELDADALGAVPANTEITGGTRFSATGVLTFSFGDYDFLPTTFSVIEAAPVPRAVPAGQGSAELRIGGFNVLRLCDTDPNNTTGTCGDGGEPNQAALDLKLARLSDYIGNVLELPDVLGMVEVENLAVLQLLATKIGSDHGVTYTAYLEEGNDIGGIDVGYLVRADRVGDVVVTQLDKDELWFDPDDNAMDTLHDRPLLRLEATFQSQPFTVFVVHPKSRSCVDRPTGSNCTQANVDRNRLKRFNQARSMALRVQEIQQQAADRPLLVIGDFNDYVESDGFVHMTGLIQGTYDDDKNVIDLASPNIVSPPLWNAVTSLPANEQYSFLFTENFGAVFGYTGRDVPVTQVLDHALLNTAARHWFAGFAYGRANLDAADQTIRLSTNAVGVSDHDGFVVRLATDRLFADGFGGD